MRAVLNYRPGVRGGGERWARTRTGAMMALDAAVKQEAQRARRGYTVVVAVAALLAGVLLLWRALPGLALGGAGGAAAAGAAAVGAASSGAAAGAGIGAGLGTGTLAATLDIGVLVFREGLECILVLAAITASMVGTRRGYQRPIAAGAAAGFGATLVTWWIAVGIIDSLTRSIPALDVQAATGLLAVIVLVVVMNWFFHKVYWTGWISLHTKRRRVLLDSAESGGSSSARVLWGFAVLGFTSFYREGFEVVLFLQNYRLELGGRPVLYGVLAGAALTVVVGLLTFVAHRRLPYKKMLVLTGVMLGMVLLVMVGEQVQEMQLAHWLPTTTIPWLQGLVPGWVELWFAVFPTVETLSAQLLAVVLVLGSYALVRRRATLSASSL